MTVASGSRLGPYQIVERIGAGGMGEVYRASDTRLDRQVAVKVLAPHISAAPGMRARFEGETVQISNRGGEAAEWSRHEIFFIDGEGDLQAVPYRLTATSLEPGAARRLFALPPDSAYDVTLDGQKILLSTRGGQTGQRELLHVVVGWKSRLAQR